jgi:uncharacterized RDD family membrane protein YckC
VTCPKCGYVSYPGLSQCKKCGYRFVPSEPKAPSAVPLSAAPDRGTGAQASLRQDSRPIISAVPETESPPATLPASLSLPEISSDPVPAQELPAAVWRVELAGKLEDHRRKRSRLRGNFDPGSSLDFEFGDPGKETMADAVDADLAVPSRSGSVLDASLTDSRDERSALLGIALEKPADGIRVLTSAAVEAGESQLAEDDVFAQPVEIILESPPASPLRSTLRPTASGLRVAPLSTRFIAGLADALILLVGGGLFALIFWIVGGRITLSALNLAVFGSIATVFILAYFGFFCALSSSTPGLLVMNLELRSLAGGHPTPAESFWRAFGYLVSGASLMLGFAWALADSDHLTWHDHMSGTYITTIKR